MSSKAAERASRTAGSRSDAIYDALRERITSGQLEPGEAVTEVALANEFAVSRTPIREAIKFLVWEGLLERRGRDMRVRMLDPEEVVDIYDVRLVLEQAAARRAADRRTDFDVVQLRHRMQVMEDLDVDAVDQRPQAAYDVHFAMWRATHNATLVEALERLQAVVVGTPTTTLHYPNRWADVIEQSRALVDAVADRDPDAAEEVIRVHLIQARDVRLAIYRSN